MKLRTVLKEEAVLVFLGVLGVIGLVVVFLVYARKDDTKAPPPPPLEKAHQALQVTLDPDRGIVCYYADHGTTGALSCVAVTMDGGVR